MATGRVDNERRWSPGVQAAAIGVLWALGAAHTPAGGVAPLVVTAVVAVLVGAPLAAFEWAERPSHRGLAALGDLWSALAVGAVLGPRVAESGARGLGLAIALWVLIALLGRRLGARLTAGLLGLALAASATRAGLALAAAPPWTALEPHWETAATWAPGAVAGGVAIASLGVGQWSSSPRLPGSGRAPWLTVGVALVAALFARLGDAALAEGTAGLVHPGVAPLLAACAAAAAIGARPGRDPARLAVLGAVSTLWFGWIGHATVAAWWSSGILLGGVATLAAIAVAHAGSRRLAAAALATGLGGLAVIGWPGLDGRGAAAAAAMWLVAAVWYAGTTALTAPAAEPA